MDFEIYSVLLQLSEEGLSGILCHDGVLFIDMELVKDYHNLEEGCVQGKPLMCSQSALH